MEFHFHRPTGFLANFIESIVFFKYLTPDYEAEKLLPEGYQDLIIDLTEKPKYIFENTTLEKKQKFKSSWLSGARKKLITIDAGGINSSMMVIRFQQGAAYHFSHFPMDEITDQVVDTDLLFGNSINNLREEILNRANATDKFAVVEDFFCQRLLKTEIPDVVSYGIGVLASNPTEKTIKQLSDKCGYSQKHLIHLFKKHLGLTPKALQKIQRFQQVLNELEQSNSINWTRLSLDCGYYDQAHFINEFKHYSGLNPEKYMVEKGPHLNYIPVKTVVKN